MATICAWAEDCIPDNPLAASVAWLMLAALAALAINDYIGDD